MAQSKLFIITGISGSGKTTIARQLLERGEVAFDSKINPNLYQFVDAKGNRALSVKLHDEEWRSVYQWSLNETELEALLQKHQDATRIFLCGRANLSQYWDRADKVFLLKVDRPTLLERLNSESRDNLFAKDRTTQDKLLSELDVVQDRIIEKGAITIDAKLSVDDIIGEIFARIAE
ncbi:MAG TPA: AAA family ATPase [Candidatus Saccharimonadales bacterium]